MATKKKTPKVRIKKQARPAIKKRTKAQIAVDPCGCIAGVNEALVERERMLRVSTSIATGRQYMRVEVEKLDSVSSRKADSGFFLMAVYCPFCGVKLP